MSDIIATVQEIDSLSAIVNESDTTIANTNISNPVYTYDIVDMDLSNTSDGSVLVYKSNTSKWTSTHLLEDQTMNGGFF